ncbi:hypothetical protein E2562_007852 [Oryza meyeriana var. granulata]|uniref:Uncharacterized protein n=1 Tax=Oryza meyeriana var. granulata TaxID=110450 RepID=A0A6G1F558_9ORYZ|nr:hypothetical protein E2562_007852 [Oryza meyeriana var. granulata]
MARDVVEAATADGHRQHKAVGEGGGGGGAAALVWDCGSALYDSYELTSFRRQLDAAVLSCGGRSLSMPHLPTPTTQQPARRRRRGRRLPAMLRRLFGKVLLRLRFPASRAARGGRYDYGAHGDGRPGSPWSGALTSIPEESASPENGPSSSPLVDAGDGGPSALRKAQSERFVSSKTASSMVQFDVAL